MKSRPISDLHPVEKPRERLARAGAGALRDEELLAILLRTGYEGKDVLTLSGDLMRKFPGRGLFDMTYGDLEKLKGVGPTRAALLKASWELARRHINPDGGLPLIRNARDVFVLTSDIRGLKKENFVVLYMDTRNGVLAKEFISVGTLNASLVHPREVFEPALRHTAASLILVHNHPSGDTSPSEEDRRLTKRLREAGEIMGFEVLDHVVVSSGGYFSFQEAGEI